VAAATNGMVVMVGKREAAKSNIATQHGIQQLQAEIPTVLPLSQWHKTRPVVFSTAAFPGSDAGDKQVASWSNDKRKDTALLVLVALCIS
jgi:hypothetical protein